MFRSNSRNKSNKYKSSDNRHTIIGTSIRISEDCSFTKQPQKATDSLNAYFIPDYDENFVSPSVRVKHSITYEYDDKKFNLVEDELLFLINKTNQDWWLCLRLDENLTFFAPASYVEELEIRPQPNVLPPPRPPPPPPSSSATLNSSLRASQRSNAAKNAAARVAVAATSPASVEYLFFPSSNDSIASKANSKPEVKQRQHLNYSNCMVTPKGTTNIAKLIVADKIFDESADSIISDLDDCLNKEEDMYKQKDLESNTYATLNTFQSVSKTDHSGDHILENCGVEQRKLSNSNVENRKGIIQSIMCKSNEGEKSDDEVNVLSKCSDRIERRSNQTNDDLEEYLIIPDEEISKSEDELLELESINTPSGWRIFTDCQQRYFYNDYNEDKWYIAQDMNGKHYFYNAEGKSVWELNEIEEDQSQADEQTTHFRKDFDEDLGTFNVLHNRLSVRRSSEFTKSAIENHTTTNSNRSNNQQNSNVFSSHRVSTGLSSNFKCVKIVEKGKKCKKKIIEQFQVELASPKLLFIKDTNGQKKLELHIDLKGSKCYKIEIPMSSDSNKDTNNNLNKSEKIKVQIKIPKKNAEVDDLAEFIGAAKKGFLIETSNGYKILIIHENEEIINDWVAEINLAINQNNSNNSIALSPISPGGSTVLKQIDFKIPRSAQPQNNSKKVMSTMKNFLESMRKNSREETELPPLPVKPPPQIIDERTISMYKKNAIKGFLNSFLKKRSSYAELKNAGIIKECVFGANLINLCHKERRIVPLFVEEITKAIEYKGLDIDGIYRISGNLSEVQKVRHQVDQGKYNFIDIDIHVLCGAFKTFVRELEEPLIPFIMHEDFLDTITISDKLKRLDAMYELIKKMPIPHRETLRHLCKHLLLVVEQSAQNRMTLQNVALVYGPNIVRSNPINDTNTGFNPNIMTQNILVEYILKNFNELYSYTPTTVFYEGGN